MCLQKLGPKRNLPETRNLSELEKEIHELKSNYKKSRRIKFLRFLLIGFLFGGDYGWRIAQLTDKIRNRVSGDVSEVSRFAHEIEESGTYLIHPKKARCLSRIELAESEIVACEENNVLSPEFIAEIRKTLNKSKLSVMNYNDEFVKQRKNEYKHLWSKGLISLDDEQQTAIVTDDKHNLVVAAAGSGKTEVLITRIAYLIKREPDGVEPNRILAIAYQRKAMEQIEQRLRDRYGIDDVWVRTFHKLGKDILERSGRIIERTDIVDENRKFGFVKSFFEEEIVTNRDFYRLFIRYIKTVHDNDDEPTEADKGEVVAHAIERSYVSINGTKVNSRAEKEIMDCLLTHKINGKPIFVGYEPDVGGFRPDFYLPQFDVFIEHWGLRKDGEVPEWFSQSTDEYRESMEKKKKWFAENNRLLMETFAYEYNSEEPEEFDELLKKRLLETLQKKFPDRSFEFSRLNYEEILNWFGILKRHLSRIFRTLLLLRRLMA